MRILVFSTDDFLYPAGGAEMAFGEVARRLPHITFDLVCARLRPGALRYEQIGNVHIHRVGFGIRKIDGIILALWGHRVALSLAKKHSYQVLWSVMASYGGFSAVRVKNKLHIPFILTLQEGDSLEYIAKKTRFVKRSFRNIFASADALHSISRYLEQWGRAMGFRGEISEVIPNGVDIKNFSQPFSYEVVQKIRATFGFSEKATVLITSSRLVPKNGIADLVDALEYLPEEVCLVICGTGVLEKDIRTRAEKFPHRVKFMGFVKHSELPLLLAAADIFVRPSITEGLGNAFLEAMAARRVVVGTNVGGIADFLSDGTTGFVCKPQDSRSIAEAVMRVSALLPEEYKTITECAYNMVVEQYDWDIIARDMKQLFDKVRA